MWAVKLCCNKILWFLVDAGLCRVYCGRKTVVIVAVVHFRLNCQICSDRYLRPCSGMDLPVSGGYIQTVPSCPAV